MSQVECSPVREDPDQKLQIVCSSQLHPLMTVYSAELIAISEALVYANTIENNKTLIVTDSMSTIQHLKKFPTFNIKNHLVKKIIGTLSDMQKRGKDDQFLWVKSHAGIEGNGRVDDLAKQETELGLEMEVELDTTDLKEVIRDSAMREWQRS
ncbi:hypothetical protein O3M35_008293 [Rhynocoris fuscipes]|uniref:ribonuclease H n=1 Tax=Rhynocoris fuscipes TaxID=488301 RepID=A0AAW1DBI5_9HEMI